jgi:hypothetical protein
VVVVVDGFVDGGAAGRVVVGDSGWVVDVGPGPVGAVDGGVVVVGATGVEVPRRGGRPTVTPGLTTGMVVVTSPAMVVGVSVVVVGMGSPGPSVVAAAITTASSLGSHERVGRRSASSTLVTA